MGFYFDAPTSLTASAADKVERSRRRTSSSLLSSKRASASAASSNPFLGKLKRIAHGESSSSPSLKAQDHKSVNPTPTRQSQFFRLPLDLRQKVYGYIVGQNELLHVLLRYRASPARWRVAYRRCHAGGIVDDCALKNCREFHDLVKGSYYGKFDNVGGLFLTSRDIYEEASQVLYNQNTLEFDHPLSFITLSKEISLSSLHSIRSITIDLQRQIYTYGSDNFSLCTSLHPNQWLQMWEYISTMSGLEIVRVRFQLLIHGWMGWTEQEILEPLYNVKQPLRIFEVDMPWSQEETSFNHDDKERKVPFKLIAHK
ncbi:hypothetical protein BP6252_13690 [Coleophoma cylindrospora]|uniref:DUF7730 domain-containing protein n=1 Tax=Coleophoma cylindrospora TaxID=1849047 RepID=A0A3D8Q7J7_9HELO|nr:hypothetical protein BP6252_13690 [Coleophoma cylindrospora]